jgi:hypothetical protein
LEIIIYCLFCAFSSFQVVENLTTKTYKPEVAMSFYKEDIRLDSRAEVKLGDNIQMIIRVTNNANGMII